MDEKELGLRTLISNVLNGTTHKHYKRVVNLAKNYRFYSTAEENLIEYLKDIREHEAVDDLKYRSKITSPSNPALFGQLVRKPNSLQQVNGKKVKIEVEGNESSTQELKEISTKYFGRKGVESFTYEEILSKSYIDPNAWLLVDFKDFDENNERAQPYPVLLESHEVTNFEFINGVPKWLIVDKPSVIVYKKGNKTLTAEGSDKYIYLENISIKLTEVKVNSNITITKNKEFSTEFIENETVLKIGTKKYQVSIFEHNTGVLQANRIGYKKDILTNNETLVSFIHPALNNLKEVLALSSYRDVMNNKQAFARVFAFADECKGEPSPEGYVNCKSGTVYEESKDGYVGRDCKTCKGTGINIPTSEMQGAIYPLPKNKESGLWDLAKLIHIERAPIENLEYFISSIKEVKERALESIYGNKINQDSSGTESYQSRLLDAHEQNKALKPLAESISQLIMFQYDIISRITDLNSGLVNIYQFPDNLGFVSNIDLIEVVKSAREANVPTSLILPILDQQAVQEFSTDKEEYAKYKIERDHKPFFGENPLEVNLKFDRGQVCKEIEYLYANFDHILKQIRKRFTFSEFYSISFEGRDSAIMTELNEVIEKINEPVAIDIQLSNDLTDAEQA